MSPIPSVPTAFALSPATPSIALDPGSAGQPATAMSQHLLGTGGLLFAVVAIVSVAGYFYHGRGTGNNTRARNTWASLTSFFSSMCHRGSATTSKAAVTDWPIDLEAGPEHVSMVYARFFHPTCWNLVECHPATSSAPAICVEDEAEIPTYEPKPFGMSSFLDMDDDNKGEGGRVNNPKGSRETENLVQGARPRVERVPPYDTSSATDINFSSDVIGTTVRVGAFLSVQDEHEDDSSEASSDSELDFTCSLYDGILTMLPGSSDDALETSSDSESDLTCSPYDGILTTPPVSSDYLSKASFDSEFNFACSPYDGILMTPPESFRDLPAASSDGLDSTCLPYVGITTAPLRLSPRKRRYGMVDMADLAQTLKDTIPEEGFPLVHTISRRTGLCDVSEFVETNSAMSRKLPDRCELVGDTLMISSCDIDVHDRCNRLRTSPSDPDVFVPPHEGLDLMRSLLEELRDPNMDCTPRSLSEDNDSEYSEHDEDKGSVPRSTPTRGLDGMRRVSLESSSTTPRTNSDVSDEGPIYPLTPPPSSAASYVHKALEPSAVTVEFDGEAKSPTSPQSPPSLPSKAHIRTRRDSRSFLYGPRSPLMALPRL